MFITFSNYNSNTFTTKILEKNKNLKMAIKLFIITNKCHHLYILMYFLPITYTCGCFYINIFMYLYNFGVFGP